MKDELQDYMHRPKRYDNIDGTGEMYMGLMLQGFALLGYLQTILPRDSMWRTNGFAGLLFMYMILIPVLALGYLARRMIKKHITWPRTGYVAFPRDKKAWWTGAAAAGVLGAVIGAILAVGFACLTMLGREHHGMMSLARAGYLAFWVLGYAFWIWRMGRVHRWKWLVLLFMALGLFAIALVVPGGFIELSRPVMLFVGLTWLGSGMATLYLYIRHNQPPAPETE